MADADFEGVVTSVAVPRRDLADQRPCFVFTMPKPTYPPAHAKAETIYVYLEDAYAKLIVATVMSAYSSGAAVQVGLVDPHTRIVAWVQLPRAP